MRKLDIIEKIRNFLLSKNSREFLIFLFFLFVSFSFWLLQVLNDDYEKEFIIPLKIKNVPENVVMTSELPEEIRINVKDRGTVLVNYMLGHTFYPVVIDYEEYLNRGNHVRIPSSTIIKRISSQLNQSTRVQYIKPDTLEYIYTQGKGKKIPVKLEGNIKAERQYYISEVQLVPDSVMVYAPPSILDTITGAYTEFIVDENISDTTRIKADFVPVKGARFIPSYTDATFMVDVYAEKNIEVPIQGINFPENEVLRTFPPKVQVTFQVGLSHFKSITAEDFTVQVDYNELQETQSDKCRLNLIVLSNFVNHARMNLKEVDYIIEQQSINHD